MRLNGCGQRSLKKAARQIVLVPFLLRQGSFFPPHPDHCNSCIKISRKPVAASLCAPLASLSSTDLPILSSAGTREEPVTDSSGRTCEDKHTCLHYTRLAYGVDWSASPFVVVLVASLLSLWCESIVCKCLHVSMSEVQSGPSPCQGGPRTAKDGPGYRITGKSPRPDRALIVRLWLQLRGLGTVYGRTIPMPPLLSTTRCGCTSQS